MHINFTISADKNQWILKKIQVRCCLKDKSHAGDAQHGFCILSHALVI